jgi:tRNA (mo5U34)-methyltransferase
MSHQPLAGNPQFARLIQEQVAYLSQKGWFHSIELPEGNVIRGLHSLEALKERLSSFPIPENLEGKRVLDVGAWTGWCSFEMERRGAEVVAVDCVELEEFQIARSLLGSRVELRIMDVEELAPENVGLFDYVLFFGVFYHLRNPLLGLEKICALTKEAAFVESYVTDGANPALDSATTPAMMEFYEADELGGQIDNWYGPNTKCLLAMCRSAGFARVSLENIVHGRARVTCYRHWEPPPTAPTQPAPWIHAAVNNRTGDLYFHKGKDEYVCLYFKTPASDLTRDKVRVEVDGSGVPVLVLADLGRNGWQANFRVPPGLSEGPHEVRVRTLESHFSNTYRIEMCKEMSPTTCGQRRRHTEYPSETLSQPAPVITHLENSVTETRIFRGYRNEYLICWFTTPETNLTREDVVLEIDQREQPVTFLCDLGNGAWQTNSRIPADLGPGRHSVRIRTIRSPFNNEEEFYLEPD